MSRILLIAIICVLWVGCGEVSKTTIYNDNTYQELSKAINVRIKNIDGKEYGFYKIEVVKVDENYIYARCWERKKSEPIDYKFSKQEVIIESTTFSGTKTANYVLFTVATLGLILLLNIILSK